MPGSVGAMVLCAGLGTRLRPLSDHLPKPACPVLNRPLLAYNLALLKGAGVETVVINVHHLADAMTRVAGESARSLSLELRVSREEALLGTGGGLAIAEPLLPGQTFFLLNGDFLFDVDLDAALSAHRSSGAAATLVVQPMPAGTEYRPLFADAAGRLACLPGQPPPADARPWHFTGVHVLERAIFAGLSRAPSGLFDTGYRHLLARKLPVFVHVDAGAWRDIGAPAHYLQANLDALQGRLPLGRYSALPPASAVDPSAHIEGSVEASVVGPGARVAASASLRECVVWPNTRIESGERLQRVVAVEGLRLAL